MTKSETTLKLNMLRLIYKTIITDHHCSYTNKCQPFSQSVKNRNEQRSCEGDYLRFKHSAKDYLIVDTTKSLQQLQIPDWLNITYRAL